MRWFRRSSPAVEQHRPPSRPVPAAEQNWLPSRSPAVERHRLPAAFAHDWALVDVETSGLRPGQHRVLQVAVITVDPVGEQTGEWSTLINPGCDPGPVHIHGLTPQRLAGAPTFDEVAETLARLLRGRTFVAHNASFDYDFLRHEFARAGLSLPVERRLCTLALNRRLGTPAPNMRLGTLAQHYLVPQQHAHDALDDTRVLRGILQASLTAAAPLGLDLPLVTCPPKGETTFAPRPPKRACAYRSPGRWQPSQPLIRGMRIAITGDTARPREELIKRGADLGLNMMSSVSRHTSALVTNDAGAPAHLRTEKARRAVQESVPVMDEAAFLRLLDQVQPGVPLEQAPIPAQRQPSASATPSPSPRPAGPLTGHRVLVLGDNHPASAAARSRVVELGAAAAVNLSASVTDVLALAGHERDKRWQRITRLELPVHSPGWLDDPTVPATHTDTGQDGESAASSLPARAPEPLVLAPGQVEDLPDAGTWTLSASWADTDSCEVDVVAFVLDETEQVTCDDDMVFYNNPEALEGAVTLHAGSPNEQGITLQLDALPGWVSRVRIAVAIDGGATFGDVGALVVTAAPGEQAATFAETTLDAATVERTLTLVEVYRRADRWRLRSIGQGWEHGLAELAVNHGVEIDED